jgi:hypothetical protein
VKQPFTNPLTSTGPVVLSIFNHPNQYEGKVIHIIDEVISPNQMMEQFSKVLSGTKAEFVEAKKDEWISSFENNDWAREIYDMCHYSSEYGYFQPNRDFGLCEKLLGERRMSWEQFLKNTGWKGESFQEWRKRLLSK